MCVDSSKCVCILVMSTHICHPGKYLLQCSYSSIVCKHRLNWTSLFIILIGYLYCSIRHCIEDIGLCAEHGSSQSIEHVLLQTVADSLLVWLCVRCATRSVVYRVSFNKTSEVQIYLSSVWSKAPSHQNHVIATDSWHRHIIPMVNYHVAMPCMSWIT